MMSEEGVSSVAVTVGEDDRLLSAISVTDIAKVGRFRIDSPTHYNDVAVQIVVPSENSQILSMPVQHFVSRIKVRQTMSLEGRRT